MSGFADSINRSQQHIDDIASSLGDFFKKQEEKNRSEKLFGGLKKLTDGVVEPVVKDAELPRRKPVDVASLGQQNQAIPPNTQISPYIAKVQEPSNQPLLPNKLSAINDIAGFNAISKPPIPENIQYSIPAQQPPINTTSSPEFANPPEQTLQRSGGISREQAIEKLFTENPELFQGDAGKQLLAQAAQVKALRPDPMDSAQLEHVKAQTQALKEKGPTSPEQYEARAVLREANGDSQGAALDRASAKSMRESKAVGAGRITEEQQKTAQKSIPNMYLSWAKEKMKTMPDTEKAKFNNSPEAVALDLMQGNDIQKIQARAEAAKVNSGSFAELPEEDKAFWFDRFKMDGTMPPLASRDVKGRDEFIKSMPRYFTAQGVSGSDMVVTKAQSKAYAASIQQQRKSVGMMGGFVRNLNEQINRVETIQKDLIKRVGARALDVPIREWNTRFAGSGQEKVLESYLTEISNEIAKLSTGSQGSVAELSVGAQDRWNKIHDPNLTAKELKKVLDATREQAKTRQKSANDEIVSTTKEMESLGKKKDVISGFDYTGKKDLLNKDYDSIPSGTVYTDPNGVKRTKP